METKQAIAAFLDALGVECTNANRDLLERALNPAKPDQDPLVLPDPMSADGQMILALLKKGQVPTCRAVAAGAAAPPRPHVPARQWTVEEIDHFGKLGAAWIHEYHQVYAQGPTWNEFFSSAPIEQILNEFGVRDLQGTYRPLRRDLIRSGRQRGWFAFNTSTRSLCAGPSYFASVVRSPNSMGRRVASAVRRFTAANEGRRPNWEDLVEVHNGDGDRLFRDLDDARDQALWLVTEQWVEVKAAGLKPGARAKSVWRHSQARRAHGSDIDAATQIAEAADAAR
ncbi:hypothetical protein LIX17_25590 (plasmid) [Mycobacterium avium subsp. hominissuis]|uniref:hypothetical protein n=1 Tax=Mycobacterium avium TaxID=1764 RepID=UPI003140B3B8